MKLRRVNHLMCYWKDDSLRIDDYQSRRQLRISASVILLLDQLTSWTDLDDLLAEQAEDQRAVVEKAVLQLRDLGLVETDENQRHSLLADSPWNDWGPAALYYHLSSRDADYVSDREERRSMAEALALAEPPPQFKEYRDYPFTYLPRTHSKLDMSLNDALMRRRTHRDFSDTPVPLDILSTILHITFAPMAFFEAPPFGMLPLKTSPSAGARHETECYVAAFNVKDLLPGLYHYSTERHGLSRLRSDFSRDLMGYLSYEQRQCRNSAFSLITTASLERLSYKYKHQRAYRLWFYDIGHIGQTFALVCTALGLGPFQTAAFRDAEIERELGVESSSEYASYILGAGYPLNTAQSGLTT